MVDKKNLDLITNFVTILETLRIFHWQTKSFSEHSAFGKVYSSLEDLVDKFIEAYQGCYGRIVAVKTFNISISNYSNSNVQQLIDEWIAYLDSLSIPLKEKPALLNIRDEMLEQLDVLKYLLTLK